MIKDYMPSSAHIRTTDISLSNSYEASPLALLNGVPRSHKPTKREKEALNDLLGILENEYVNAFAETLTGKSVATPQNVVGIAITKDVEHRKHPRELHEHHYRTVTPTNAYRQSIKARPRRQKLFEKLNLIPRSQNESLDDILRLDGSDEQTMHGQYVMEHLDPASNGRMNRHLIPVKQTCPQQFILAYGDKTHAACNTPLRVN